MIHVFHGFLGSPHDFSFLKKEDVLLHDLYSMKKLPSLSKEDILIGYSMGGRICLELAERVNFNIKKLVLINAHPGLSSPEGRTERKIFENKIITNLTTMPKDEFLKWWNGLPLFQFDQPIETSLERYQQSPELFSRHLLSEQKDHLPQLTRFKDKVIYIVGLQDERYVELSEEKFLPHDIMIKGILGGHRLYQHEEALKAVLIEEGIL